MTFGMDIREPAIESSAAEFTELLGRLLQLAAVHAEASLEYLYHHVLPVENLKRNT